MRTRYAFLVVVFGFLTLVWSIYLFSLQIFDPFNLTKTIERRYSPRKEMLIPTRGSIYDANGNLLVSSISYYQIDIDRKSVSIWAEKKKLNLEDAFRQISEAIGKNCSITPDKVMQRLKINDKPTSIMITNKVREMELDRIIKTFSEKDLPGLNYGFSSMKRIYSQEILAARLLGSVRADTDGFDPETASKQLYSLKGICGIESTYNDLLAGAYGWRDVIFDANHERVPYPNLQEKPSQDGYNLHLTIDSNIQEVVENALYEGLDKYKAKNAGAIVMDPNTGKILAMAGVSDEDRTIDPGLLRVKSNIPISFMYEPGSTMKPLTMLPAVENHLVSPTELIPCGVYVVNGRRIGDTHHYGALTPSDIIAKSSNVGIARIAERIGSKRLYEKFVSLGFGQKTALRLQGETSGMFAKLENWDSYTLHSISFGQGISVTALQEATAYCAIANGGKLMKPYLVDSVKDNSGKLIKQFEPEILREVGTTAATDTIRSYMQAVIDRGTGKHIKTDYITIGGKTGTAQKAREGGGGYAGDKYVSVFVGLFPVEAPKMVVVVFYDEPQMGYHYGSTSAAPTFKKIVEDILFMPSNNILAFDDRLMQSSLKMPDLRGKHIRYAEQILAQYGFSYKVEGADSSSVVIDQFPKPNVSVEPGHPITIKVGKSTSGHQNALLPGTMPDLCGLTLRKALQVAAQNKVAVKVTGSGIVRQQSIQPGSRLTVDTTCVIEAKI